MKLTGLSKAANTVATARSSSTVYPYRSAMLASGLVPKQIGVTASPVLPSPTRDKVGGVFTGQFQQPAAPGRRRPPAPRGRRQDAVEDGIGPTSRPVPNGQPGDFDDFWQRRLAGTPTQGCTGATAHVSSGGSCAVGSSSVVAPAVTRSPAEHRFHLGAVEGRPRILVIAGESVVAVVVLSHQLTQSPLRPGVGRRDQAHLVAAARPFQRRAVRSANVTGVDVAPEVCLAEARVVPLCLEPVVAVRSDDIVDAQPYPRCLRVADGDRVRDHFADVLAQGIRIRGRMPLSLVERDLAGNCALGQQAGRHLTRGVNDPRNPEVARRLHEVVGAQHVVVKDVDLRLTARGGIRRQMTDTFGSELEERIVDLARVRQFYPAELSWQLQLWSAEDVEVHDLVTDLGKETDNPPSGTSGSSCHDDSHLEKLPSIDLAVRGLGTPLGWPRDSRIKILDDHWVCAARLAG